MYKDKNVIAIIPAREGSKRLPGKNIKELFGKPLIVWTIEVALTSIYIDEVIVSTDDKEIAEISKNYGAKVPFLRPEHLANDYASSYDVAIHTLDFFERKGKTFDFFILLQPTSPLRNKEDINTAFETLNKSSKAIVSVCKTEHSPLWYNTLPKGHNMRGFLKNNIVNKRSQDLPVFYRINGAIYISEVQYYKENKGFFGESTRAYIMPNERSVDIDTHIDFALCKILLNENN